MPFGQNGAFGEAGDAGAQFAHEAHVVLDHHHRAGLGDLLEQLRRLDGLGVGHAGDRFVDQQQFGVLRQQHADLEPLLLAVAEVGGELVLAADQADGFEDFGDARMVLGARV